MHRGNPENLPGANHRPGKAAGISRTRRPGKDGRIHATGKLNQTKSWRIFLKCKCCKMLFKFQRSACLQCCDILWRCLWVEGFRHLKRKIIAGLFSLATCSSLLWAMNPPHTVKWEVWWGPLHTWHTCNPSALESCEKWNETPKKLTCLCCLMFTFKGKHFLCEILEKKYTSCKSDSDLRFTSGRTLSNVKTWWWWADDVGLLCSYDPYTLGNKKKSNNILWIWKSKVQTFLS